MISLFIDTTTNHLRVGIYKDKKECFYDDSVVSSDLSSKALPKIKEALDSLDITIDNIDDIYVVNGPGSFTGIRVGVTIAKTMAFAKNKKIYTVSELELLASGSKSKIIVPLIDARRGFVYAGIYNKNLKQELEDQYINLDELKKYIKKNYQKENVTYVSYDKIDKVEEPLVNIERLLEKGKFTAIEPHLVNPNYLKKTEAEEKLNDKKS